VGEGSNVGKCQRDVGTSGRRKENRKRRRRRG
jgi:hypothetical protein